VAGFVTALELAKFNHDVVRLQFSGC